MEELFRRWRRRCVLDSQAGKGDAARSATLLRNRRNDLWNDSRLGGAGWTAPARGDGDSHIRGRTASFQAKSGHRVLPGADQQFEKTQRSFQDKKGAVIGRRQRRLGAVPADQDMSAQQEFLWEFLHAWFVVMRHGEWAAGGQESLKVLDERRRWGFRRAEELAREDWL